MILTDEDSGTHNIDCRRASNIEYLDNIEKSSFPGGSTSSNYLHGRRWCFEPGHCAEASSLPANHSTVAATLLGASSIRSGKRRSAPRSYSKNFSTQNYRRCRSHLAHNTYQCHTLEYSDYGQDSRFKRSHYSSDMAEAQFKASFNRDLQAKPGQTIHRKTTRCCWSLSKSARQGASLMCRRIKVKFKPLDRTRPSTPLRPGIPARQTHDYTRHGTTTLFAALSMLDGKVIGDCMPQHRHQEFIRFLQIIAVKTPLDLDLHLIVDNYGTHKHPRVQSWLKRHPRLHLHFIPTSSSWLNMTERWFGEITNKRIRRGSFKSVPDLITAIMQYIETHNQNPHVFVWSSSVDKIMAKITKCKEVLDAPH